MTKSSRRDGTQAEALRFRLHLMEGIFSVVNNLIRWGGLVGIAYCCYKTVAALSGKVTMADIGVGLLGDIRVSQVLSWTVGLGGVGYGLTQRSLRRSVIERVQPRVRELESRLDERRSSSQLTSRGDTRPEDK